MGLSFFQLTVHVLLVIPVQLQKRHHPNHGQREAIQLVNKNLAKEVVDLQEECTTQKAELSKKR